MVDREKIEGCFDEAESEEEVEYCVYRLKNTSQSLGLMGSRLFKTARHLESDMKSAAENTMNKARYSFETIDKSDFVKDEEIKEAKDLLSKAEEDIEKGNEDKFNLHSQLALWHLSRYG